MSDQPKLEILAFGMDTGGRPFIQKAYVSEFNVYFARIGGLQCEVAVDAVIGITYADKKARFEVVSADARDGQITVHPLEPDCRIWPEQQTSDESTGEVMQQERRRHSRYLCSGLASVWSEEADQPFRTPITDISLGGCYFESLFPLPAGLSVRFKLNIEGVTIQGTGEVRTSDRGVGMGIQFVELSDIDRNQLKAVIERLALRQQSQTTNPKSPQE